LAQTPGVSGNGWRAYFGPLTVQPYDSTTAYFSGEMVYKSTGIGTYQVFIALLSGASDDPNTSEAWLSTTTYNLGNTVVVAAQNYVSLVDLNTNNPPASSPTAWATTGTASSLQWGLITGAVLSDINFIYPVGTGPVLQQATRNVYQMPCGFLRLAPQDPKQGATSILGAPTNLIYNDWVQEDDYLITRDFRPLVLRFASDVTDISSMDSMFCEGLAARLAYELCEPITQSTERLKNATGAYQKNMTEARIVNAIETSANEPPEDDFITCRI
jgi:hypothetical protein